jgi:hypothetical protein
MNQINHGKGKLFLAYDVQLFTHGLSSVLYHGLMIYDHRVCSPGDSL